MSAIFKSSVIFILLIIFLGCSTDERTEKPDTITPPTLTIVNNSKFDIEELYIHTMLNNYSDSENFIPEYFGKEKMKPGESIYFGEKFSGKWYITFVREISSTSAGKVAVTTAFPLNIDYGDIYLYIYEDDFTYKKY